MKMMLRFLFISFLVPTVSDVLSYNFAYDYRVVDRDATRNRIEFNLYALQTCEKGEPSGYLSEWKVGIYKLSDNSKAAELTLPLTAYDDQLSVRDSLPGRPCITRITYSTSVWLERAVGNGYIVQFFTSANVPYYNNIDYPFSKGPVYEFRIPEGIDLGFQSPKLKNLTLFTPPVYQSAWFDFSEDPGTFDSVRYTIGPLYSYTPPSFWKVPDSRVFPDLANYKTGFDSQHPLGSKLTFQLNDTGTLYTSKILSRDIYQIPIWSNHYRNGKKYPAVRFITVIPSMLNQPHTTLSAQSTVPGVNKVNIGYPNFHDFINGGLYRCEDSASGVFIFLRGLNVTDTVFYDSAVLEGNTYGYYIRGINGPDTIYSSQHYVTTKITVRKINLSAFLSDSSVDLRWTTEYLPSRIVYQILHGTHPDSLYPQGFAGTLAYSHHPEEKGRMHYYQVMVIRAADTTRSNILGIYVSDPNGLLRPTVHHLEIYPNPVSDIVFVKSDYRGRILLYSSLGQIILDKQMDEELEALDISLLAKGTYILQLGNIRRRIQVIH